MKLLHINASPRGANSYSLEVADYFTTKLAEHHEVEIDRLDLFAANLPEFGEIATGAKMALFAGRDQTNEEVAAWDAVRAVFDRFAAADMYVFNVPIWNNGVPYKLKHYIDLVTQPGWSFGFGPEAGYSGLMTDRKAVIVHASGVWHSDVGKNFGSDFSTPVLKDWLGFLGVTDVHDIRVQPTVLTADVEAVKAVAVKRASELIAIIYRALLLDHCGKTPFILRDARYLLRRKDVIGWYQIPNEPHHLTPRLNVRYPKQ
ncbi:FMN-dependent NADH-azoreductase [Yoonia maritima]|uniref:FMN dependent NADH:quinone oxidoreductase n=1 Tax=Yoonia maritima TaxID=1435347 RepID=A0A2T0VXR8_9RHOB|nr:NAD(P)H-dependent oxidoreductase [Yoonia maritima]PRY76650.1 FMN-dependent NADH-azoreductase [Yoonia maritima]